MISDHREPGEPEEHFDGVSEAVNAQTPETNSPCSQILSPADQKTRQPDPQRTQLPFSKFPQH